MASYIWRYSKSQQKTFCLDSKYIRNTQTDIIAKGNIIDSIEAKE